MADRKTASHAHLIESDFLFARTVESQRTQTSLVVKVWVGEVEVSMKFPVIELYCHGVMSILIDSPYETRKVKAFFM